MATIVHTGVACWLVIGAGSSEFCCAPLSWVGAYHRRELNCLLFQPEPQLQKLGLTKLGLTLVCATGPKGGGKPTHPSGFAVKSVYRHDSLWEVLDLGSCKHPHVWPSPEYTCLFCLARLLRLSERHPVLLAHSLLGTVRCSVPFVARYRGAK